ncbi:hypothetical protein COI33_09275 [Neisseria meningitidis]|nr:hypothetical protein A6J51_01720 [Neisseria meningitidis]AVH82514.1 hypothetical protein A6J54_13720 [Neisseria meningitidis]AVH83285.1 hypothetical protein A6J50_13950 [Neisseria meningitidis]MBG8682107.1 hypothetical protein [Neisseria meningitidis]MBG8825531.1 hypothetical protein [Neisseria meningitidis]
MCFHYHTLFNALFQEYDALRRHPTLRLAIKIPKPSFPQTYIPSFPRKWESRISDFQIIFEYCRCPMV